jgi:hypothetical protein
VGPVAAGRDADPSAADAAPVTPIVAAPSKTAAASPVRLKTADDGQLFLMNASRFAQLARDWPKAYGLRRD